MSEKIRIKDVNGARRELLRASRMQRKARWLFQQGDLKNCMEVYHASTHHTAEAMMFILAYCPYNQEINKLLLLVTVTGISFEARFNLRKEAR